jgi:serine/threonine-protein kinase HipA
MARAPAEATGARVLGVYLEPTPNDATRVGSLLRDSGGNVAFTVDQAYVDRGSSRPVLSSAWCAPGDETLTIERLLASGDKRARAGTLPPWFANLLPEGALREIVEREMGAGHHDDFDILARLGRDLPGAVVVRDEGVTQAVRADAGGSAPRPTEVAGAMVKFSLAGIQLKFSMIAAGRRLTMPGHDELGRVMVKLPAKDYPRLPELEYAAMQLAAAAGVSTTPCDLAPVSRIEGLPARLLTHGEHVLVVPRFDRSAGRRIHFEDFAQIMGAVGDRKYTVGNEETNLRLLSRFVEDGAGAILEAVRRTTVNLLLGNGDAHLKNWALIYPDGVAPSLSPAYDIVPTIAFGDTTMALRLGGTRSPKGATFEKLGRAARYVDMDPRVLEKEARRTVAAAADTWPKLAASLGVDRALGKLLRERWTSVPIAAGVASPFE